MSKIVNIVGQRFGKWTALSWCDGAWLCRCECGHQARVNGNKLRVGKSTCCVKCRRRTHGKSKHNATYQSWKHMRRRCLNPTDEDFKHYGGRGIKICPQWSSFSAFLTDMGEKPIGLTLDRRDNDGDYTPDNCRWATQKTQTRNQRRNRALAFKGRTQSLADWCEELNLSYFTVHHRLRSGWTIDAALDSRVFTSRVDREKRMGNPK